MMEGFLIGGWDLILPKWRLLDEPQIGVSTPCGVVLIKGTTMVVPSMVEF